MNYSPLTHYGIIWKLTRCYRVQTNIKANATRLENNKHLFRLADTANVR